MCAYKKAPSKGLSPMDKKVPKNKKYENIGSKLDTGMTVNKVNFISNSEYSRKRDEIFFRLTKSQLYQLYSEYEADEYEDIAEVDASYGGPKIVTYSETERPVYEKPYLILDIRDRQAFDDFHLMQAQHFPSVMLRRDQEHPELRKFRNKDGHLIIVVSEDEASGRDAAKVLVDRGSDNVFLLCSSVREFAEEYPSFVEGNVPSPKKTARSGLSSLSDSKSSRGGTSVSERSSRGSTSSGLTREKLNMLEQMESKGPGRSAAGPRSGAAATALAAMRHPGARTARDRAGLRSGRHSDTMSTESNTSSAASVADSVISRSVARKGKI